MSEVEVRARLLEWGNSYGIRLSRDDVKRFGLKPNQHLRIKLDLGEKPTHIDDLPSFDLGRAADRHDELFAQSVDDGGRKERK